ncbi:MAG: hypothetical protein LBD18_02105 [Treponema sp.]|jgi:hypothetical protein|nr:hypothetical protein [Treponema sp.]
MQSYIQILIFVVIGVVLLWLGYTLFMGRRTQKRPRLEKVSRRLPAKGTAAPGEPQVCPICSSRLNRGEMVKTLAFPSITGGQDRLMHIRGCVYCLEGNMRRSCPVCGSYLRDDEILVARMFQRSHRRAHIHVLGCSRCKRMGKLNSK